jgi:hypothetical protein
MNLTPKKDFQEKKQFADSYRDLVVSAAFREALRAAFADYILSLTICNDPDIAAATCHRIEGAKAFIEHLLNIAEMPKTPPTPPSANLDHSIR